MATLPRELPHAAISPPLLLIGADEARGATHCRQHRAARRYFWREAAGIGSLHFVYFLWASFSDWSISSQAEARRFRDDASARRC